MGIIVVCGVTATVVFVGVADTGDGATVVLVVATGVGDRVTVVLVVATVVSDGATVVLVVATGVGDGVTVVAFGVSLPELAGSTMRSIARNTASSIIDDLLPRDIDLVLPAGFAGDFL